MERLVRVAPFGGTGTPSPRVASISETALTVESFGISICVVNAVDVVTDRSWRRWIHPDEALVVRAAP
jgi:hypothetical protein